MNSSDLKPWQAQRILNVVQRFAAYLRRLRLRMEARRFAANDPLYRAVLGVQRALTELEQALITIILGRPPAKPEGRPPVMPREQTPEEYLNGPPPDWRREERKRRERERH